MFDQRRIAGWICAFVCAAYVRRVPSASYFRAWRFESKHFILPLTGSERGGGGRGREGESASLASREQRERKNRDTVPVTFATLARAKSWPISRETRAASLSLSLSLFFYVLRRAIALLAADLSAKCCERNIFVFSMRYFHFAWTCEYFQCV